MELINGIQIEVTQIQAKIHNLSDRRIFKFKRLLFMSQILSIKQDVYFSEDNEWVRCSSLVLDTNEWIKVSEKYNQLNPIFIQWWKDATEKPPPEATE
jgi:hypothetical protein